MSAIAAPPRKTPVEQTASEIRTLLSHPEGLYTAVCLSSANSTLVSGGRSVCVRGPASLGVALVCASIAHGDSELAVRLEAYMRGPTDPLLAAIRERVRQNTAWDELVDGEELKTVVSLARNVSDSRHFITVYHEPKPPATHLGPDAAIASHEAPAPRTTTAAPLVEADATAEEEEVGEENVEADTMPRVGERIPLYTYLFAWSFMSASVVRHNLRILQDTTRNVAFNTVLDSSADSTMTAGQFCVRYLLNRYYQKKLDDLGAAMVRKQIQESETPNSYCARVPDCLTRYARIPEPFRTAARAPVADCSPIAPPPYARELRACVGNLSIAHERLALNRLRRWSVNLTPQTAVDLQTNMSAAQFAFEYVRVDRMRRNARIIISKQARLMRSAPGGQKRTASVAIRGDSVKKPPKRTK